ncbi:amidohydrolase family protein [Blastococcus mobilis]|uniref:Predicted metal-dependent hydrolase, TIM-barrel fold n=1 Tax=Blastococcus mobilis TaxID=1938746 RepID=A0A238WJB7_9ACTN|nr:amidohydrolase family protein [Blastococcus mobilis]SNR46662.1 Predicted metal-dependent hydrolase, TIM-barrel fold [Blastococcus mobilis]
MTGALIDVHSHVYPPSLVDYLRGRAEAPFIRDLEGGPRFCLFPGDRGVPVTAEFTHLDAKLAFMSDAGITHSVVSPGNPWLDLLPGAESISLAGAVNAELAEMADQAPDRIWAMGLLPNDTVSSAIETLEELAEQPSMVGVMVGTRVCRSPLDAPELEGLWAAAASAGLPIFVHPAAGLAPEATRGFGQALTLALAFPFETTVAVARLVLAGTFERHPDLRVVAAHGGGVLPALAGRLKRALEVEPSADQASVRSMPERAPGLYVDSILFSPSALRLCADVLGTDRVLFGTDHPFPIADARGAAIDLADAVQGEDYERIACRNAIELFGLPLEQPTDLERTSAVAITRGDRA